MVHDSQWKTSFVEKQYNITIITMTKIAYYIFRLLYILDVEYVCVCARTRACI